MRVIFRLRATGHLTEQQVLTAARFGKDPNRFRLAPTGFRFLHDVIVKEAELERLEQSRGWAARSAKVVLSVLLHMIEETEGVFWSAEIDGTAEEMLAYLKGDDNHELLDIQSRLKLTPMRARVLQILMHARGPVSRDTLMRRLEGFRSAEPDADVIDVHVCHIRKALPEGLTIRTHRGFGYELVGDFNRDAAPRTPGRAATADQKD